MISFVALAFAILPYLNISKVMVMKIDQHANSSFNPLLLPVSFILPYNVFQNQTKPKAMDLHAKIGQGSKTQTMGTVKARFARFC